MDDHTSENAQVANGMRDSRTHVNRQKGRHGIEVPRTVEEQRAELELVGEDGRRRRDPVGAADAQRVERDDAVGGAWIDRTQRASGEEARLGEQVHFEKLPGRHERRFDDDR
jgi:hypothetical protein